MITIILIIITGITSYLAFQNPSLFAKMQFNAALVVQRKEYYRMISHGFIHADWNHLIFNMITLFFFGRVLEQYLTFYFAGKAVAIFFVLYFGGMIVSNIWALLKHKNDYYYNAVGASGAVSSILFASILFNPLDLIYIWFIPMPGIVFGVGYLIYSYYMSRQKRDNIAHDAHFLGSVFGFVTPLFFEPSLIQNFFQKLTSFL